MPDPTPLSSELPKPSAELVLYRVHVEAIVAVMGRKKSGRYLRLMADALAQEENLSSVFQIRPMAQQAEAKNARRQAVAIFQRFLPTFLARVPPD